MLDKHLLQSIKHLSQIGLALSRERDIHQLMDRILSSAKDLTNADGGTLYLSSVDGKHLEFAIVRNDTLNIYLGGVSGRPVPFAPVNLCSEDGERNLHNVSAAAANLGVTINVPDAYHCVNYDFSGTMKFDQNTGYHSQSFLTVPMRNHEGDMIGVLQLINARHPDADVRAFDLIEQSLVESLTSMAATALTQRQLIDAQKKLFDSVVKLIASAIDAKSAYTSGHCQRVPIVAHLLAEACNRDGQFAQFSDDELYELDVSAWLHDCGKLATPDYIMDKRTKLDGLNDRISEVETRLAVSFQQKRADLWESFAKSLCHDRMALAFVEDQVEEAHIQVLDTASFLRTVNQGDEFMAVELQERVKALGAQTWASLSDEKPLLSVDEIDLLNIARGTLSSAERKIINDHIVVTIDMLKTLPYPKKLLNVVEIAGGHHERVDGKGYPFGLMKDQLSVRARILAIADVFEALTAKDRPYKQPKTLSETMKIMGFMAKEGHIDADLYQLFLAQKVYLDYAKVYMSPAQIDMS